MDKIVIKNKIKDLKERVAEIQGLLKEENEIQTELETEMTVLEEWILWLNEHSK